MNDTVLILGDYQQSLVVVRSLARAGYRVMVGETARRAACGLSRYAHEKWVHPDTSEAAPFLAALDELLAARADIQCIFPVGESDLVVLIGAHGSLAGRVRLVMPAPEVAALCLDKPRSYAVAAEVGIPLPAGEMADTPAELDEKIAALGLPLVFKCPDSSRLIDEEKAVICASEPDLQRWRQELHSSCPLLVQRLAPGERHNCHFLADQGRLTAYFQQRVTRTDKPNGTGFGVAGVSVAPDPELRRQVTALIRRLAYTGVGCVQFLVDEASGTHVFLEINPRLDATCELPYKCGLDLPLLALDPGRATPKDYPLGRRFYWPLGEARGLMQRLKRGTISRAELARAPFRMLGSLFRARHNLTWDWRDPLPTLYLYWQALLAGGRRTVGAAPHTDP